MFGILFIIGIGLFGGLLLIVQRMTAGSLQRTHQLVQALPLPTPLLLVHVAALVGLFLLWAWLLGVLSW